MDNWRKLSGCAVSSLCTWLVSSALILCTQQVWNALSPLRLCPRGRLLGCRIGGGGRRLSDPKPKPSWAGQTFASASSSLRDGGLHRHVLARVSRVWSPLSSAPSCMCWEWSSSGCVAQGQVWGQGPAARPTLPALTKGTHTPPACLASAE